MCEVFVVTELAMWW